MEPPMPDRYDNANIIDKAFDVAVKTQIKMGEPSPDEVSFVMGFIALFGILTGRVDIGLDEHAPLDRIFDAVHEDIVEFGRRVARNQDIQNGIRETINGWKH
jgi:hypothetical protein